MNRITRIIISLNGVPTEYILGGEPSEVVSSKTPVDVPVIWFDGPLPTTKELGNYKGACHISSTKLNIDCYATLKVQGNSSTKYNKKNFTITFYSDLDCTIKLPINFGWGALSKYVIKANWIDLTHSRNVVGALLWGDVVKSRPDYESIPELLKTSPNYGAVDGFPIKFYGDNVYWGRYTMNIPKDAWMTNMDKSNPNHLILCGENYWEALFRAPARWDETDWTDELHTEVPAELLARFNLLVSFVMSSSDEDFYAHLGDYVDIQSVLDYYAFGLLICNLDGFGKNHIWLSYDGNKFIASAYDMDSTFGLYWDGSKLVDATYGREMFEDIRTDNPLPNFKTGNLLYIRLEKLFINELIANLLRLVNGGSMSYAKVLNRFENFINIIPQDVVKEDYASTTGGGKCTGIPSKTTNNILQLRKFYKERIAWVTSYLNGVLEELNREPIVIALNSLNIVGDDVALNNATYSVEYNPADTTQLGVTWSIISGGEYASITNEGILTVNEPVESQQVVLRATSVVNESIYVDKTITAMHSHEEVDIEVSSLTIIGDNTVTDSAQYSVEFTPNNATSKDITWSISSGSEYASISQDGVVTVLNDAASLTVVIRATANNNVYAEKTITVSVAVEVPITGLTIVGPTQVIDTAQFSVQYEPENTTQTAVRWTVSSTYATFDANGVITIKPGYYRRNVTITATSIDNSTIKATKTIYVTSSDSIPEVPVPTNSWVDQEFDSTNTSLVPINTGLTLCDSEHTEWTLLVKLNTSRPESGYTMRVLHMLDETVSSYPGIQLTVDAKLTSPASTWTFQYNNSNKTSQVITRTNEGLSVIKRVGNNIYVGTQNAASGVITWAQKLATTGIGINNVPMTLGGMYKPNIDGNGNTTADGETGREYNGTLTVLYWNTELTPEQVAEVFDLYAITSSELDEQ